MVQFLIFKKLAIPQQTRKFRRRLNFQHTNYPQSLQWDYEFFGIFSVGPPFHSDFLQKYGKNRAVTHTTQIQIRGTYASVGGA